MHTHSSFKSWRLFAVGAAALCLGISQTKGDLFSMHGLDTRAVARMNDWAFLPRGEDLQQRNIADNAERTWPFDDASDLFFSGLPSAQDPSPKTIRLDHRNLTLTVWGNSPLSLTSLIIRHGTLTLQGTAGTAFIINIRNQFSLSHSAKIVLSGGLTPEDVVFNVLGSGSDLVIRGQSELIGTLHAVYRIVRTTGRSVVIGDVIASEIKLSRGGNVIEPPVVSP
jgi:hypothetical protein